MPDEPVYRITLVRHGESVGNAEARVQGHADYPLSDRGRAQIAALARRFKADDITFDHVIASPLSRALETARIIAAELNLPEPETDTRWIEWDAGQRTGMTYGEAQRLDHENEFAGSRESGAASAESNQTLYFRGNQALHSILERPPARYLVSSHRAILNMVLHSLLGIAPHPEDLDHGTLFRLANGSFSRFRYYPQPRRWQVDVIGDRSHWKGEA